MTKEKALEISLILKAYSEGKTIQRNTARGWMDIKELVSEHLKDASMDLGGNFGEYRIKPEKKLVPFTYEDIEVFLGRKIRSKNANVAYVITSASDDIIGLDGNTDSDYDDLLMYYTFFDGSPCGKYVEE